MNKPISLESTTKIENASLSLRLLTGAFVLIFVEDAQHLKTPPQYKQFIPSALSTQFSLLKAPGSSTTVEFVPFYGGARGQYLEVTKDVNGKVIKERIVSEDNISNENIVKNRDETLLSRVLGANLESLKSSSTNLLRLHNKGRNSGSLTPSDKTQYKKELYSLGEAASDYIKLFDEIGDDVDMLFKKAAKQYYEGDEVISQEGQDSAGYPDNSQFGEIISGSNVAEAKPIGLAVVENGLASSRPMGSAIASHGIAIARPIATAISGINPAALGLQYSMNH